MRTKTGPLLALVVTLSAPSCDESKKRKSPPDLGETKGSILAGVHAASADEIACSVQPFANKVDLPEASAVTFVSNTEVLLIGDSGNQGAFAIVDAASGELLHRGELALDTVASDDIEGASLMNGTVYAITSSGWVREWTYGEGNFSVAHSSYALAPPDSKGLLCYKATAMNCGKNFEGLCLRSKTPPSGECAGFAAAKATGELMCVVSDASGRLALDPSRVIAVAAAKSLSGCSFDEQERLWFGNNSFAGNAVGYVENWRSPSSATTKRVGKIGLGFAEGIAIGSGGQMIRASDTAGSPSLLSKYICR